MSDAIFVCERYNLTRFWNQNFKPFDYYEEKKKQMQLFRKSSNATREIDETAQCCPTSTRIGLFSTDKSACHVFNR